ncbi:excalibur calcium-binding domain-containing protein [Pseudoalteromonas umbrosa]|uniref:excalibur calcium-binding domain-containing protein n=1 Tax=Pseudoalteromonas umbrosa TaxID=3048489 RepID=UPI0024C34813|nr:excalibur calcium-binding domain-containing protein [Pseudoalteromonas sp. B95]MDK1289773.1 excalibur calcium-binding domain-containing protein [Pseudoalteromonas sp. B95]
MLKALTVICLSSSLLTFNAIANSDTWRGLIVEPENRCSPYDKKTQYPYSQSVEDEIVASMGGLIYGPYTGSYFESDTETDIEHIIATSEAHDSGLCAAPLSVKKAFASDLLNLTLAAPRVNRCSLTGKCGKDAAEWMPAKNKCWFANRIIEVRRKYSLSIDIAEAARLDTELATCTSTEMIFFADNSSESAPQKDDNNQDALALYDDNKNGRITCAEARKHNIAPVRKSHIAYPYMSDRDGDGVVCE